jgi:hypothetical protein
MQYYKPELYQLRHDTATILFTQCFCVSLPPAVRPAARSFLIRDKSFRIFAKIFCIYERAFVCWPSVSGGARGDPVRLGLAPWGERKLQTLVYLVQAGSGVIEFLGHFAGVLKKL